MAIEVKTMDVENYLEHYTIQIHTTFGWNLKSSQRVFDRNTRLENRNGDTYAVTETVDFTKLVFERDTSMRDYYLLERLEGEYLMYSDILKTLKSPKYPSSITLEEWANKEKPDITTGKAEKVVFWMSALSLWPIALLICLIIDPASTLAEINEEWYMLPMGFLPSAFIGKIISELFQVFFWDSASLRKALANKSSKQHQILVSKYNSFREEAELYESTRRHIDEIIAQAKKVSNI